MNAFADWLFSALFGWMGTAANSAWNAIVNASGGISDFFSKYWLVFVLIIVIGGTILDYAVWFVRWRPYLVWRSWFTRKSRLRRHKRSAHDLENSDMDEDARSALAGWVGTPHESYSSEEQRDAYFPNPLEGEFFSPDNELFDTPNLNEQYFDPPYIVQTNTFHQPSPETVNAEEWDQYNKSPLLNKHQAVDYFGKGMEKNLFQTSEIYSVPQENLHQFNENTTYMSFGSQTSDPQDAELNPFEDIPLINNRRRRSEKNKKSNSPKKFINHLRERIGSSEEEETMLDGLPSPVRPEDAFHEPIYPQSYHYQDTVPKEENRYFQHNRNEQR